jgi:hypothetical protein
MANNNGKGWHGDTERHAEASRERDNKSTNWLPLLLLPVAFGLGWAIHDAATTDTREVAQEESTIQPGVGGGPESTISPTGSLYNIDGNTGTDATNNTNGGM